MPDVNQTSAKARAFLEAATKWVDESTNSAISDNIKLKRRIDFAHYRHTRLDQAANKAMSIGVYGASQAGKSYFVSALAKGKGESVSARIGERDINFLTEINPSGGKESTGLVTRFTRQPLSMGKDFPVKVSLLSELDLVKIVANSFYEDLEPDAESDVQARIARSQKIINEKHVASVSEVSVEALVDLNFYCDKHFANYKYYSSLKQSGYWTMLEQLAPISDLKSRQKYYSLLWDGSAPYDRLFAQLSTELCRFAGSTFLMCEPSALFEIKGDTWTRSESSVINVTALEALGHGTEKQVKVLVGNSLVSLPLSVGIGTLSALASEITISIASEPHEFFDQADLLDFPGARSRHPISRQRFEETVGLPIEHFLRGKVAYLFEGYCNNFGMSSLLLCVGPSNQEVVGLNRLIEDWIADTVGVRPEQRDGQPETLFAVLTKFDSEFVRDTGKAIDESRWSTRITASLGKPFGAQQSTRTHWLDQWDRKSAFKNTYWWRSPSADQPGLIKYGPNRTEASILEERKDDLVKFRLSYLQSDLVRKHFRDPESAWDAALKLNDGGAEYIVANLALVCRQDLRDRQIHAQFVQNCEGIASQLRNYLIAGNSDEMQTEKIKVAGTFLNTAARMLQRRCAGEFLSAMVMDELSGIACYEEVRSDLQWSKLVLKTAKAQADLDVEALDLLGLSGTREPVVQAISQSEILVRAFVGQWASNLREKFQDQDRLDRFGIDLEFVETVCAEAITGLERSGCVQLISHAIEQQHYQHESSWKSATILTTLLNDFLVYTSLTGGRAREVNRADGASVKIFANTVTDKDVPSTLELSDSTKGYSRKFLADWALGFYEMIKQNAFVDLRDQQMIIENQRLGAMLEDFSRIQVS